MKWMKSQDECLWVSIPHLFSMLSICGGLNGTYFSSVTVGSSIHSHPQSLSCFCMLLWVTRVGWPDMCRSPVAQRLSMFHHTSMPVLVPMRITLGPPVWNFSHHYTVMINWLYRNTLCCLKHTFLMWYLTTKTNLRTYGRATCLRPQQPWVKNTENSYLFYAYFSLSLTEHIKNVSL